MQLEILGEGDSVVGKLPCPEGLGTAWDGSLSLPGLQVPSAVGMELQFPWLSEQSQGLTPWPYSKKSPRGFEQVGGQPSVTTVW